MSQSIERVEQDSRDAGCNGPNDRVLCRYDIAERDCGRVWCQQLGKVGQVVQGTDQEEAVGGGDSLHTAQLAGVECVGHLFS